MIQALATRTQLKTTLAPLNIPVKFRGETLPLSGSHIVIDLITDTPLITLELEESGAFDVFQVNVWAELTSTAVTLANQAHNLLEQQQFYRRSSRFTLETPWFGVSSDYDIFS